MTTFKASVTGVPEVTANLAGAIPAKLKVGVSKELESLGKLLLQKVKAEKLSGQVLHVRSDTLRSSTTVDPSSGARDDGAGNLYVTVGTKPWYGRMWELTGHKEILPKTKAVLAWKTKGTWHFAKRVAPQGPRPYLRPALDEMRPLIIQRLTQAIKYFGSP